MAEISIERYLRNISERVYENKKDISQKNKQRRDIPVDLYGIEYTRSGKDVTFYIAVSPDLIYYERFQFKLDIQPYNGSTVGDDFEVYIEGINITDYLIQQEDGEWIDGPGLYPNPDLESDLGFYDILQVASVMWNESQDNVKKLLRPGYKKVRITSSTEFTVTLSNFLKYNHVNR